MKKIILITFALLVSNSLYATVVYDTTLIGNQGGTGWANGISQSFTTDSGMWELDSILLGIHGIGSGTVDPIVRILNSDLSGSVNAPDYNNVVSALTINSATLPSNSSVSGSVISFNGWNHTGLFEFAALTPVALDSNTQYWIQAYGTQTGTTSISYNDRGTAGTGSWLTADDAYFYSDGSGPNNQAWNGGSPAGYPKKAFLKINASPATASAAVPVPEPSLLALMSLGMICLFRVNRRKVKA
jgi:hypothetical protein